MGLLDQVNPTKPANPNEVVELKNPYSPYQIDEVKDFSKWEVNTPEQTTNKLLGQVKEVPGMATEGLREGNDAAAALFNANTTAFSRAISNRATRSFALGKSTRNLSGQLENVQRQNLQTNQNLASFNELYKLRRANFAGQLEFASKMQTYQNALSSLKLQTMGSVIGSVMGIAGMGAAGAFGGAMGGGKGDGGIGSASNTLRTRLNNQEI